MKNNFRILILLFVIFQNDVFSQILRTSNLNEKTNMNLEYPVVTFGICTDVHQDIIYNGEERMQIFVNDMTSKKSDFIIQLGDFCYPKKENDMFISIFQEFGKNAYSVIGNHDRDNGVSKEEVIKYYKMPAAYYSFDKNGFHFIVMDGNEEGAFADDGYFQAISTKQIDWLKKDLRLTNKKTVIFIHQSLVYNLENYREKVRKILSSQRLKDGSKKVIICFNGHRHSDKADKIDGIWYITINSMSDIWVGKKYEHKIKGIPEHIYKKNPDLKYVCPYADPLYAFVTINKNGTIVIKGKTSSWMLPSPMDLGIELSEERTSKISDRILK